MEVVRTGEIDGSFLISQALMWPGNEARVMGLLSYARQAVEPCSLISIKSRISLCSCPSHFKMVAMSDHEHHML